MPEGGVELPTHLFSILCNDCVMLVEQTLIKIQQRKKKIMPMEGLDPTTYA
jgi:hypothetical protein